MTVETLRNALEQSHRHYAAKADAKDGEATIGAEDAKLSLATAIGSLEGRVDHFSRDVPKDILREMKKDLRNSYRRSQSDKTYEDGGDMSYPTTESMVWDWMAELCTWLLNDLKLAETRPMEA